MWTEKKKKITINYPVSINDKYIVNIVIDYAASEYHLIHNAWSIDSSMAKLKENEIHNKMLKRAEEKYRTWKYLNEVKEEVKERIIEYFKLLAPEYAVEINL